MKLVETQTWALLELGQRLNESASGVATTAQSFDPRSPVQIQKANTFGLLGPRGAGKSTLLSTVYEAWSMSFPQKPGSEEEDDLAKLHQLLANLLVLRPLDCSILSADVAPGAAILLHLERELPDLGPTLRSELRKLAEQYGETTEQFRTLAAELAATLGEYNRQIVDSTRNRLTLGKELASWLDRALKQLDKKALLVLLDDFDLVHAREVRRWIFSLLDELHQERLFVVLTADFYRLEHLSFDPKAEIDDLTGRALLDKLLPSQNRVVLERWDIDSRASFSFTERSGGLRIRDRLREYAFGSESQLLLLTRLLPGWPRGLQNLMSSLDVSAKEKSEKEKNSDRLDKRTARFLRDLASCRSEHLLARELYECDLVEWVAKLSFKDQLKTVEAWEECVSAAQQRCVASTSLSPLSLLQLDSPKQNRKSLSFYTIHADLSGRDLLRHEELRGMPLKDADDRLAPVWVEALLNYAMADSSPLHQGLHVHNRIRFVANWPPVMLRFRRARFRVKLGRAEQRRLFEDHEVPESALLWFEWPAGIDSELSIGWEPLIAGIRRARSEWQVEPMRELLINIRRLAGTLPPPGDERSLRIIPDHVWAIVLLTEGLDRCPWEALSVRTGWELRTYLVLAILFVRSAFMYALDRIGDLPHGLCDGDRKLLETLRDRDALSLLRLQEEEILNLACADANDLQVSLAEKKEGNPLAKAALCFLESEPYKVLNQLLNPGPSGNS